MPHAARHLALAPALLLAACATTRGLPLPMTVPDTPKAAEFRATGEFRSSAGKSAAFDGWRVVGPQVNLARNPDGSWDGTAGLEPHGFHLDVKPGELHGPNLSLAVRRLPDGVVEVGGLFLGERYLVRVTPSKVTGQGHDGRCSFELQRVATDRYAGDVACGTDLTRITIELHGLAARIEEPVLPQAALALLVVLP